MKRPQIDYSEIDSGIRGLVRLLNEIPFVATEYGSCEGHLRADSGWTGVFPYQGHKFLYGGYIMFWLDNRYKAAKTFLSDLERLKEKYNFVDVDEHHCCEGTNCSIDGIKSLDLGYCDLTHPETIKDDDTLETMIKKRHQVPIAVGEKRIAEYKQVWAELTEIARRYVPNPKSARTNS